MRDDVKNGEVRAALLPEDGRYVWGVVYVNRHGAAVVVGSGYANNDAAKSAAWRYAKAHNATFVSSKRLGGRS